MDVRAKEGRKKEGEVRVKDMSLNPPSPVHLYCHYTLVFTDVQTYLRFF